MINDLSEPYLALRTCLNSLYQVNARVWNGCIIWKITNFRELFLQAKNGETPAVHSFPFYTGVPGAWYAFRILAFFLREVKYLNPIPPLRPLG